MERYWVWEYGLFEKNPKRVDSLNPETTLEVVKLADAQATVGALQARVKELEAGKSRMILDAIEIGGQFSDLREAVRALKEVLQLIMLKAPGYDWNTDPLSITLMVGNALTKSDHVLAGEPDEENDSLQSQLTQRTVELHETQNHLADADNEVEQLRKQLSERTAELEAASKAIAEWRKEIDSVLDKLDGREGDVVALQAELERVRALIKALPKVEGEIMVSESLVLAEDPDMCSDMSDKDEAMAYAALLKHRQGMEG